jgi:hypothetical protein
LVLFLLQKKLLFTIESFFFLPIFPCCLDKVQAAGKNEAVKLFKNEAALHIFLLWFNKTKVKKKEKNSKKQIFLSFKKFQKEKNWYMQRAKNRKNQKKK